MFGRAQSQYTTISPPAFLRGIHIQQAQQPFSMAGVMKLWLAALVAFMQCSISAISIKSL
jgi:hypothetical protein